MRNFPPEPLIESQLRLEDAASKRLGALHTVRLSTYVCERLHTCSTSRLIRVDIYEVYRVDLTSLLVLLSHDTDVGALHSQFEQTIH